MQFTSDAKLTPAAVSFLEVARGYVDDHLHRAAELPGEKEPPDVLKWGRADADKGDAA